MGKKIGLFLFLLSCWFCLFGNARTLAQKRPNILFIMADDLGYGDLGCYGGEIPTPNIDALSRGGLKLTSFYTAASTCTPSRFGLLTGMHPVRSKDNLLNPLAYGDPSDANRGIRRTEKTIAAYLREAGYQTALIGKWHLGHGNAEFLPTRHGFGHFWGYTGGAIDFFTSRYGQTPDLHVDETIVEKPGYVTDLTTEEAVRFLRTRPSATPFFLCLHYNAPHFGKPWNEQKKAALNVLQGKPEYVARFSAVKDSVRREYSAMLTSLDEGVGKVLAALKSVSLDEETLVIFTSDNGGSLAHGGKNLPLRGQKSTLFEGGIRVPCLVRWTGRLAEGTVLTAPVSMLDWFSTWMNLANPDSVAPNTDGIDVWPYLTGKKDLPRRTMYWSEVAAVRDGGKQTQAIRAGDWKLIKTPEGKELLFDLKKDPAERDNLAEQNPKVLADLRKRLGQWYEEVARPKPAK